VIVLVGATATGKSSLALDLANRFPLEIVNIDASQFYIGMDVGTAKPTPAEMKLVPHHLFDIAAPDSPLNAGRYIELADAVAAEIRGRGKLPLFVGGTGMYVRALLKGLADIPEVERSTRERVAADMALAGTAAMHRRLAEVDPDAAERISENDTQRISRALEVYLQTGRTISHFQELHRFAKARYDYLRLGLKVQRTVLKKRLAARVVRMFDGGFPEEVGRLLSLGYQPGLRTFKALGYRDVMAFVTGECSREEAMARVTTSHARYAKRQHTWFRREEDIHWFSPEERDQASALVKNFCARI